MSAPLSYIQPKHAAMPAVPGTNGQPMAWTWQGPGRKRHPLTHVRSARPTGGKVDTAATPAGAYATSRSERRRIQRQNRKAYRQGRR